MRVKEAELAMQLFVSLDCRIFVRRRKNKILTKNRLKISNDRKMSIIRMQHMWLLDTNTYFWASDHIHIFVYSICKLESIKCKNFSCNVRMKIIRMVGRHQAHTCAQSPIGFNGKSKPNINTYLHINRSEWKSSAKEHRRLKQRGENRFSNAISKPYI